MADIDQGVIDRIVSGDTTLNDLNVLKDMFKSSEMTPLRKEFVAILGEKLSPEALHKFNSKVMEYSVELADPNDNKFVYRTPEMKFFQEMLVLEARREGMRVELSKDGVAENTLLSSIPPKIMEHYATLSNNLHKNHGNESDALMAEVISWGLTASLARESEYYKKADKAVQISTELDIVEATKQTNKALASSEKAILSQIKATSVAEQTVVKPEQEQVEGTTKAIIGSYKATQKSLEIIRKSLDSLGQNVKTSHAGQEVERVLLESVKQMPYETLQNNEAGAIEFLKGKLQKKTKNGALTVSDEELQQIKVGFIAKCSGQEPEVTGFVSKIISTLKNLQSYFIEVIARLGRAENKALDNKGVGTPNESMLEKTANTHVEKTKEITTKDIPDKAVTTRVVEIDLSKAKDIGANPTKVEALAKKRSESSQQPQR